MSERRVYQGWRWLKRAIGLEPERRQEREGVKSPKPEGLSRPAGVAVPQVKRD